MSSKFYSLGELNLQINSGKSVGGAAFTAGELAELLRRRAAVVKSFGGASSGASAPCEELAALKARQLVDRTRAAVLKREIAAEQRAAKRAAKAAEAVAKRAQKAAGAAPKVKRARAAAVAVKIEVDDADL